MEISGKKRSVYLQNGLDAQIVFAVGKNKDKYSSKSHFINVACIHELKRLKGLEEMKNGKLFATKN